MCSQTSSKKSQKKERGSRAAGESEGKKQEPRAAAAAAVRTNSREQCSREGVENRKQNSISRFSNGNPSKTLQMGKIRKDEEDRPVKTEKKSKKNKTSDQLDVGDGGFQKEKGHKHRGKKRKSESSEDGDEARHEEGNLEDNENNHISEKEKIEVNELGRDDGPAEEQDCDPKPRKEKKRKHKHHNQEKELENDGVLSSIGVFKAEKRVHDSKTSSDKNIIVIKKDVLSANKNTEIGEKKSDRKGIEISREELEEDMVEKDDKEKKKKKKKKKTNNHDSEDEIMTEEPGKEGSTLQDGHLVDGESKTRSTRKTQDNEDIQVSKGKQKKTESVKNNLEKPKAKPKSKRVSFSSHVEVYPSSDKHKSKEDGLIRGKWFTPEEDEILKDAVLHYIEVHSLGDDGLKKVLNCHSYPGMKNCWSEIATCMPYRPSTAIYYRAHILFERAEKRSWSPEEIEFLKEFHKNNGNQWKIAAAQLGKHRFHVKDTWRRIKIKNSKGGRWTQDEYQKMYDLVNLDLRMKVVLDEKKSKHGMLRDNIPWCAISDKLTTRSDATCCAKWYNALSSSLVVENKWSDSDDYRLVGALYGLDAACEEDVDWDGLLVHRSGEVCQKRWSQMVRHIGHRGGKSFVEQVDTLAMRYVPELAETREAWDNKPVTD